MLIGEATGGDARPQRPTPPSTGSLRGALASHSIKDAAALVAAELDLPKRDVYARALALAKAKGE